MFSKCELEVIRGVSMGWSNAAMATKLGCSDQKVVEYIDQVLAKLKLSSRIELAFYACTEEGQTMLRGLEREA